MAVWDAPVSVWDGAGVEWQAPPPPGQGWGDDWRWWYQIGAAVSVELTGMIVEARWTTDGHSLGDGTFRGDIQPGTLTVRMWDPTHLLDNLDKQGAIWAIYKPTGACWCWFYDSFSRGLFAPGDPQAADCVFVGTQWPSRLTSDRTETAFPAQAASVRLGAIINALNANTNMILPAITGSIAAQAQIVAASQLTSAGIAYPGYLALIRDAASNGVAWMAAAVANPDSGPGALVLNYARWEAANQRVLDRSQIIAGPPVTASADWMINWTQWAGTLGATGATSTWRTFGSNTQQWGLVSPGVMRIWGDVTNPTGPEYPAVNATGNAITFAHANPFEQSLSTVSLQSGARTTPAGGASSATWDPLTHVFSPIDVASITDDGGTVRRYWVVKSDHRLTATIWETSHTLEKYVAAIPLP